MRADHLQWLFSAYLAEVVILTPPDREEERSFGATAMLEKWFARSDCDGGGLPRSLLRLFHVVSRHPSPRKFPRDVWWGVSNGEVLKVSFIPLPPLRQTGPRQWAWILQEQSERICVPWSWPDLLTPEQDELFALWKEERAPVALRQGLTAQELAVATEALTGQENESIAESLGISVNTVKVHLHNVYDKVGAHNRVTLFRNALRLR